MADPFVHLHLHTEYSLLDGAIRIPDLMKKSVEYGMQAVAITDHGNMYGVIEFYQAAQKAGIKPLVGCEVYMAPGKRTDRSASSAKDASFHFNLLAKDFTGYSNLVKLVSEAYLTGFHYKPRIDKELLAAHSAGLIGLSSCLKGEINVAIQNGDLKKAEETAGIFRDIFGPGNFFLEMQDHGLEQQHLVNSQLKKIAAKLDLPLVATNDAHFLERSHHEAHDVMICIGTGAMVHDERRMRYPTEVYFKSPEEMAALFGDCPEALKNTLRIAEMCDLKLEFGVSKYPAYEPPPGKTRESYLRELCYEGLNRRFGERAETDKELRNRLDYELSVLEKTGFTSYFLIVWDFIHFAKSHGIPVGPGRGSAAGSLIAYVLSITDLDPLRFGLIFERFLNPERVSPPDIDVDFCQNRRGEVIEYVRQKYGDRAVSQIITFGTLGAKSVVRDVGRVLGLSYSDADRIAKMIPNELGITLSSAYEKNPELKQAVDSEESTQQLWGLATLLEGLTRNTGIHAAGVVIGDKPLDEYIPLCRGNDDEVVTQYAMGPLTDLGMLKMDFLGLKTLTVLDDAAILIRQRDAQFSLENIPLEDRATFALLNRGETIGVFQLESGGMTNLCKQFDVNAIDDIIALIALYRPGPMELIPDYIKRKKGLTKIKYEHPLLKEVCADTYGVMIYQEQVQRAANVLAGYTLGQADLLRRAMGKKDKEKMAKERGNFIAGCKRVNDIDEKKANAIFDLLEKFAGYGFNKSHSAAYGLISYQTAYLKANYPVEFMAGLLSNEVNNTDKISVFVAECQRMGMGILPPDINRSSLKFVPETTERGHGIRYGLAAIKNIGEASMAAAIREREKAGPFKSLDDYCGRLDSRSVNRKSLESLIRSGAFDFTGQDRAQLFAQIDQALASGAALQKDRLAGQVSLFGDLELAPPTGKRNGRTTDFTPWSLSEKLAYEKELLGFYVTGHPLDAYRDLLEGGKYTAITDLANLEDREQVKVAGTISSLEKKFTRKDGKPFAVMTLEDFTGTSEVLVWADIFARFGKELEAGKIVAVSAKLERRDETVRLIASEIGPVAKGKKAGALTIDIALERTNEDQLMALRELVMKHPGPQPLFLRFRAPDGQELKVKTNTGYSVRDDESFREELSQLLG
ncbi:MAG: DNA polymerase III subunit alpha [Verrucomicrobia bacterium]|nr:DNA polymerase III subunit alpha [Verrucomicrobiota bacterium]